MPRLFRKIGDDIAHKKVIAALTHIRGEREDEQANRIHTAINKYTGLLSIESCLQLYRKFKSREFTFLQRSEHFNAIVLTLQARCMDRFLQKHDYKHGQYLVGYCQGTVITAAQTLQRMHDLMQEQAPYTDTKTTVIKRHGIAKLVHQVCRPKEQHRESTITRRYHNKGSAHAVHYLALLNCVKFNNPPSTLEEAQESFRINQTR